MSALNFIQYKVRQHMKYMQVAHHTRLISGPKKLDLSVNDITCVILGRNVSFYIDHLYSHYQDLGIRYFIFLDNGSDDNSIDIASLNRDSMVLRCPLPFREYQRELRLYSVVARAHGGWRLVVDADELFDYPMSQSLKIDSLISYLNLHQFNGVICQMLDLVPRDSTIAYACPDYRSTISVSNIYNTSFIDAIPYHSRSNHLYYFNQKNNLSNQNISYFFGGIRKYLFGEDCCLTKHSLFRVDRGVDPLPHPHVSTGLQCADFSTIVRHYKFSGDFISREIDRERYRRLSHEEGRQRLMQYRNSTSVSFEAPGNKEFLSFESLVKDNFVVLSDSARKLFNL